jgi:hypothetical protein
MRKVRILLAIVACLACAGCIDMYQTLTRDPSGSVSVYFQATVTRATVEAMASASDSGEGLSLDSLMDIEGANEDPTLRALNGSVTRIDDGISLGIGVQVFIDPNSPDAIELMKGHEGPMIPDISDGSITIAFPPADIDQAQIDALGQDVLSAHTYRLVISRDVMPSVSRVELNGEGIDFQPAFIPMADSFQVEIPVSYLLTNAKGCELVIYR